jgi:hypothetical protein
MFTGEAGSIVLRAAVRFVASSASRKGNEPKFRRLVKLYICYSFLNDILIESEWRKNIIN